MSEYQIDEYGNRLWFNKESLFHREDGPAVEYSNGDKEWYIDGECHREDGPAVEYSDYKAWYYKDVRVKCSSTIEFLKIIKLKSFW